MEILPAQSMYRGRRVETAWSLHVSVLEVLFSVQVCGWVFHGVRTETSDEQWDWPDIDSLLWVFDDGTGLRLWQDFQHQPRVADDGASFEVEAILGDYRSPSGNVYLGVKWRGYDCPTWELEEDMEHHLQLQTLGWSTMRDEGF